MSTPLLSEILISFANCRLIEQECKDLGVNATEFEMELAFETSPVQALQSADVRSVICRIINRNLRQAARETNMSGAVYLDLQQSIEAMTAPSTSHREARIYSSKELAQKGRASSQPSLFDESETVSEPAKQNIRDDGGNYPLG